MKPTYIYTFFIVFILSVSSVSASLLDTKEQSGIVYLLFESPARIERYNMADQSWAADISLGDTPTAFAVDDSALFISFGPKISRFNLDGSDEIRLLDTDFDARSLMINGDFLYIYDGNSFFSINKNNGTLIDSEDYFYSMQGLSVASRISMAFARSTGVSPSDIIQITLNNDGTLGSQNNSPYHGDYPNASRTYVFPNQARIADNSGIVYNTNDLTYCNSLSGSFDDLAFYGDLPVVLRNNELIAYSNTFLETGRYTPEDAPAAIFIYEENIFSFFMDGADTSVAKIPIDLLSPATPGEPVNPTRLAYTPENIILGEGEIIYLLSRNHLSVFRWSIAQRDYMDTIPLLVAPNYMAYSSDTNRLYLAYPTNEITEIKLAQGIAETFFINSPESPLGLATAGPYVFVCDPSGPWVSHFTYSPEGILLSQKDWNHRSDEYVWNAANQKMYYFRDDTNPNGLLWEDIASNGLIGTYYESFDDDIADIIHPIRVSPDGSVVVLGSGRIYDAITLEKLDSFSNDIIDAAWKNGSPVTIRSIGVNTEVQKWTTANYEIEKTRQLDGTPLRLFSIDEGFLIMTQVAGVPTFSILNEQLVKKGLSKGMTHIYLLLLK